ncbi:unnamed protein product [Amoebophrya sp. A120]|nr:unnamed protein product [Amoebophrya sp. A120]|eukprot:GSA120T00003851001.1
MLSRTVMRQSGKRQEALVNAQGKVDELDEQLEETDIDVNAGNAAAGKGESEDTSFVQTSRFRWMPSFFGGNGFKCYSNGGACFFSKDGSGHQAPRECCIPFNDKTCVENQSADKEQCIQIKKNGGEYKSGNNHGAELIEEIRQRNEQALDPFSCHHVNGKCYIPAREAPKQCCISVMVASATELVGYKCVEGAAEGFRHKPVYCQELCWGFVKRADTIDETQ